LDWEIHVLDSPEKNAFVLPGGKIFVFSGILPVLENFDALAFVLGHEVGHVLARHAAEQLTLVKVLLLLNDVLTTGNYAPWILTAILSQLSALAFSRKMESEADYIGLYLMNEAKYKIEEAPHVWVRMSEATKELERPPEFLSTHPADETRMKRITLWIKEIQAKNTER